MLKRFSGNNKRLYQKEDYEIALAGNPNVGKSTVFNALTGMNQHTGNWSGKTVDVAYGIYKYNNKTIRVVDLPGTYSMLEDSQEEHIANEYIRNNNSIIVVILDSTNLLRNFLLLIQILNLTNKVIVCLNFQDEVVKKGVVIDKEELSLQLGVPVLDLCAKKKTGLSVLKKTIDELHLSIIKTFTVKNLLINMDINKEKYIEELFDRCSALYSKTVRTKTNSTISKADKLFCNKITGIPIMLMMLGVIFWLTIFASNYISEYLSQLFEFIKSKLIYLFDYTKMSVGLKSFLVDGVYTTLSWVVAVMLPPMTIFFPIFSILEDSGVLPRIAFNLDRMFSRFGGNGKQALTMAMGFGCNCCGVTGCRIINTSKERNIAIITNTLIPCNGKLPSIIIISSLFFTISTNSLVNSVFTAVVVLIVIILSTLITLLISYILSLTIYKGKQSSFVIELPPYRKPQIIKTIIYSVRNRILIVLMRAVTVAIPAGALIWFISNTYINDVSILSYMNNALDPLEVIIGLDGVILLAFILGFPANETVIPIILMSYLSSNTLTQYSSDAQLLSVLTSNGWTAITAVCFIILCVFHYPCSTTCLTIYKETKSIKTLSLSVLIPTVIGVSLCILINTLFSLVTFS